MKRGLAASSLRGSLLGCGLQLGVLALLPLLMGGAYVAIELLGLPSKWHPLVMMGSLLAWVGLVVVLVILLLWRVVSRRTRALDAVFAPLALSPVRVGVVQRGFIGEHLGREVHAWFSKGPKLELYLSCRSGRRIGVGASNPLSRGVGKVLGKDALPVAEGLGAWSADPVWARAWLDEPGVRPALESLCGSLPGANMQVILAPSSVRIQCMYFAMRDWTGESDLSPELIGELLAGLSILADSVERHPRGPESEGRLEAVVHTDRARMSRWVTFGIGVFLVGLVGILVVAGAVASLGVFLAG